MAAKDNVVIRMTAEDAGAFEMWRKQAKGPEAMGDAIEKAGKKGKQSANELTRELEHMIGKWTSIATAIEFAKKMVEEYYQTKRELEQSEAGASQAADAAVRGYFKTARISGEPQQAAATQRIGAVALRQKTSLESAGGAANLLAQFGVPREQAEGGALEEMLQMQQAAPAGAEPQEFSRRVLDIIRRSAPGGKVSTDAIHKVGVAMRQLTSSDLGFNAESVDLYAKHATMLKQAGYDTSTAMALTAAITEKYDARQARSIIKEIAKPGMQKGEAELVARARGALGTGGAAQYQEAAQIGRGSIGSLLAESTAGVTLAEMGEKKLKTPEIENRLKATMRAQGVTQEQFERGVRYYENPLPGFGWLFSDEARVDAALGIVFGNKGGKRTDAARIANEAKIKTLRGQVLGEAPLSPITVRIKGQDGRDVPHSVEAAGIPGR